LSPRGRFLAATRWKETHVPHSSTVSFLSYWRGLQPSPDRAPARARFDPAQLKSLVPQMIMISDAAAGYRFRLAGGFPAAFHGRELKDASFLSLFRAPFLDTVQTAIGMSRRRQQPVILTLSAVWLTESTLSGEADLMACQDETVTFEIVLCPLTQTEGGEVDRFVGIYQTLSAPPKNPMGSVGQYTLISARLYEPRRAIKAAHLRLVSEDGRNIA
jgi:hypothetical protein